MKEFIEYLKNANENYYVGIEELYARAAPSERVRIEDNRIALEQAITIIEQFDTEKGKDAITKATYEKQYLEIFNRIKKSFCEKRNMKFNPTRGVSKPSQLHARLKDYTMDELGKVMVNAFSDNFHIEKKWKYVSTEYITRTQTIEKYLV